MVTLTEKATLRPNSSMKSTERIKTGCRPNLQEGRSREKMAAAFTGRDANTDWVHVLASGLAGSQLRPGRPIPVSMVTGSLHWIPSRSSVFPQFPLSELIECDQLTAILFTITYKLYKYFTFS